MSDPSSIDKLNASISQLQIAIDQYSLAVEKKIDELKTARSSAEATVALSKEDQTKIKQELEKTNVQKTELQGELTAKQTELNAAALENVRIGTEILDLTGQLTIKDTELQIAVADLAAEQARIDGLNTDIANQQEAANQLRVQLATLQQEATEEQIRKAAEIAEMDAEIQRIQAASIYLSTDQQAEITRLTQERDALLNQNIALSTAQQAELDRLTQEKTDIEAANLAALAEKDGQIRDLQDANANLTTDRQAEIDRLNQERADIEATNLAALAANNAEIANITQEKNSEITRLKTEYDAKEAKLASTIVDLKNANEKATEHIQKLQNDLAASTSATEEEKEKNTAILTEIAEQQKQLAKQTDDILKANAEVKKKQDEIEVLYETQESLTAQHIACETKMAQLNSQIEEANTKIIKLEQMVKGKTTGLNESNSSNPTGDFVDDNDEEEESNTAVAVADENFGLAPGSVSNDGTTVFHPLGVPYKENGSSFIRLKDGNNNETTIPYDETTKLPKGTDGKNGSKISWALDGDGNFIKTEVGFRNGKETGSPSTRKYTIKGGRKRKGSKTIKNSAKKHRSNKRNTKRKQNRHKKQTYRR